MREEAEWISEAAMSPRINRWVWWGRAVSGEKPRVTHGHVDSNGWYVDSNGYGLRWTPTHWQPFLPAGLLTPSPFSVPTPKPKTVEGQLEEVEQHLAKLEAWVNTHQHA